MESLLINNTEIISLMAEQFSLSNFIFTLKELSENTRQQYLRACRQLIEFTSKTLQETTESDIQQYLQSLEKIGAKNSTINVKRFSLQKVFNCLMADGIIISNPVIELNKKCNIRRPEIIKPREKLTLPDIRIAVEKQDRTSLIISFLAGSGLRVSEMIHIKKSDIKDMGQNFEIHITGKGKRERTIYITDVELLTKVLETFKGSVYLFETKKGKIYHRNAIYRMIQSKFKNACKRNDITPHSLRHFFCTTMIELKYSLKAICLLTGHSNFNTLLRYYDHSEIPVHERFIRI